MLIISDLHLREETAQTVLEEVLPQTLIEAIARKEYVVGILGDLFHIRYQVSVRLLNGLRDMLRKFGENQIYLYILPGNHDQINVEGRNALEVLGDLPEVEVCTEPVWTGSGLWFPYRKPELVEPLLQKMITAKPKSSRAVLFIHHGIRGAWMNDGYQDPKGLDPKLFQGFDKVICGHYHKPQQVGDKIVYVGSPYQINAGEAGQEKGFGLWDDTTYTFVPMRWGTRFHNFTVNDGEKIDLSSVDPQDEVRVITDTDATARKVGKSLVALGLSHVVTPKVEATEARLTPVNESLSSYAQAYLDELATDDMDKSKLKDLFAEITT